MRRPPLLVERVADNPGAPFIPDVLARLCELRREDLPAFEWLRARLKKAGCRVAAGAGRARPTS